MASRNRGIGHGVFSKPIFLCGWHAGTVLISESAEVHATFVMPQSHGGSPAGEAPPAVPKPYTTPKGYVPPSIGEQFRYAYARHPYANSGLGAAVAVGLAAWLWVSVTKPPAAAGTQAAKRSADPQQKEYGT